MEDNILVSVKSALSLPDGYAAFDEQVLIWANEAMSEVYQIGPDVRPVIPVSAESTWSELELIPNDQLALIKSLVCLKARINFDPPTMGHHIDAMERQILKMESRLNMMREEALDASSN